MVLTFTRVTDGSCCCITIPVFGPCDSINLSGLSQVLDVTTPVAINQIGEIGWLILSRYNSGGTAAQNTITGWTLFDNQLFDSNHCRISLYSRVWDGTESSITFPPGGGSTTDRTTGVVFSINPTTTSIDAWNADYSTGALLAMPRPSSGGTNRLLILYSSLFGGSFAGNPLFGIHADSPTVEPTSTCSSQVLGATARTSTALVGSGQIGTYHSLNTGGIPNVVASIILA